ncbi:hypothetical protein [Nitrobacter winogradskyi]|uniref:Uncharacterized protein n=1 Tax=Nitrobacter winogradskyi TaxID=913 RepID=A0ACC6AQE1_NITWI|nr:hypothetical protein [Nitrobacter winogradskyi]MCP2001150.1 hypothetical protein [Nitrobacter winogradskyi]
MARAIPTTRVIALPIGYFEARGETRHHQTERGFTRRQEDHLTVVFASRKEQQGSQLVGALMWAKVSPDVDCKIREQIRSGVLPVRLKSNEWSRDDIVWLLDVIAPTKSLATRLVAEIGRDRFGNTPVNAHPLLKSLIDSKALRDLGAEPMSGTNGEHEPSNQ